MLKNKTMMMFAIAAVSGLMAFAGSSYASLQEFAAGKVKQTISQEINEVVGKLHLTDEQKQSIEPILEKAHQAKKDILQKAGLDVNKIREQGGLPKSQRRELMKNLHNVDKQTSDSMAKVLDRHQMKQWKSLQDSKRKARQHMWKAEKGHVVGWGQ